MEAPTIKIHPAETQTVIAGGGVIVQCIVTGVPEPSVRWFGPKGAPLGSHIEQLAGGYIRFFCPLCYRKALLQPSFFFRLNQITPADAGEYTCSAENEAGRATGVATIVVNTYPELSIYPSQEVLSVDEGNYVKLECRGDGVPRPTVQWLKPEDGSV